MRAHALLLSPFLLAALMVPGCGDPKALEDAQAELASTKEKLGTCETDLEAEKKASAEANAKVEELQGELEAEASANEDLEGEVEELKGDKDELEGELDKKKAMLEQMKVMETALAKSLVKEIEAGDIQLTQRGGYLVVDVADQVLFEVGEAEIKDKGKAVLDTLAASLKKLPRHQIIQVSGHTDNQKIKSEEVKAKFPTNWELSTSRATNVVRYLQETGKIPGKRLVAAGFSEYRPVAKNRGKGRKRNRRIEIALLPPPQG